MEGDTNSEDHQGVIPRALKDIFERLEDGNYQEHSVKVTYLEIYNEELCDLLWDSDGAVPTAGRKMSGKLTIVEDKKKNGRGTYCHGLREVQVTSVEDVLQILTEAQQKRQVAETRMNKQSSRSHCLFSVVIHTVAVSCAVGDERGLVFDRTGRLHLCDLAGSECAKAAGGEGSLDRERKNINQSLLTLGRVITTLQGPNAQNQRIPYRDSKLTRILQEALGGRSKTCIIATISPSQLSVEETLSTLPRRRTHTAGSARLVNSRRITTVSIGRLAMQVTIKTGAAPPKMRLVWYGKFCVVRFRIPPHP